MGAPLFDAHAQRTWHKSLWPACKILGFPLTLLCTWLSKIFTKNQRSWNFRIPGIPPLSILFVGVSIIPLKETVFGKFEIPLYMNSWNSNKEKPLHISKFHFFENKGASMCHCTYQFEKMLITVTFNQASHVFSILSHYHLSNQRTAAATSKSSVNKIKSVQCIWQRQVWRLQGPCHPSDEITSTWGPLMINPILS